MSTSSEPDRRLSRFLIGGIVLAAFASFLILTGHGYHALAYAPFLLLLACPFLHMFMHGGHGGYDGHRSHGWHGGHGDYDGHQLEQQSDSASSTGSWTS